MSFPYTQNYLGLSNGLNTKQGGAAAAVGGWIELGRTTLSSAGDNITVSSLPDKRYYMVLQDFVPDTYAAPRMRLGNGSADTGSNYSDRRNENGGTDATRTSQTSMINTPEGGGNPQFIVSYIANLSGKEKLCMHHSVHRKNAGAANAAGRGEAVSKWVNTSNPLDVVDIFNNDAGAGDFASGSEVVVLGWDESDTHTNNFWEELASVELGSAADEIDTGTITAKKYLWVQVYIKPTGAASVSHRFNDDTGTNYAHRQSTNGGTDTTNTSIDHLVQYVDTTHPSFTNMFIVNNSGNEKLVIGNVISRNTSGAGTAPQRREFVGKWTNTSTQITDIKTHNAHGGSYDTGSILKVWGAN